MIRSLVDAERKYVSICVSLTPKSTKLIGIDRGQESRSAFINNLVEKVTSQIKTIF